jgi:hypothetical protein
MFAPIRLGDLGIFLTATEFDMTEVSSYLDDLLLLGHNKCPRCNTEMFQDYDPRVLEVNFIPNNNISSKATFSPISLNTTFMLD